MTSSKRRHSRFTATLLTAAALAGTALWVRHSAKKAEENFPPSGRFIEVDGVRLHYHEWGSGDPVVLLHGNGAMATDFVGCGLAPALAANHRVIAFDRPGFGYSERPRGLWLADRQAALLAKACTMLGATSPIVVGQSWGTHVALAMGLDPGVKARGLVLIAGYYFPTARLDAVMAAPRLPVIGDVMRYTVSPIVAHLAMPGILRRIFKPHAVAPEFLEAVPEPLMLRPWQIKAGAEEMALLSPGAAKLEPHYRELHMPVEIFAGTEDGLVKQEDQSPRLHEVLPKSTLHMLPDEGHMLHYRASGAIAEAVERIARSTANASHTVAGTYDLKKVGQL